MEKFIAKNIIPFSIICLFGILYSSISLVNHYLFRTAALDLGLYSHTIYDYSHFRFNNSLILKPLFDYRNQLSDHFDLFLMLVSPLNWIFGNYTLLIVQIVAILFGGYGIYLIFKESKPNLAIWAMVHFYSLWGIYSALGFDYHSNVVGAMLVPWTILYFRRGNFKAAFFFSLFTIICKENMALWMGFVWLGLAIEKRHEISMRNKALLLSAFSLLYFIVVLKFLMPLFIPDGSKYIHFFFKGLGNTPGEALVGIFQHPLKAISLLFTDPLNRSVSRWIKLELHVFILLSGGFALLINPRFLIMLIPIFAQKLFHDDYTKWGIYHQYSIEFVPILCIALFTFLGELPSTFKTKILTVFLVILTFFTTLASYAGRESKYSNWRIASPFVIAHYQQNINAKEIHTILNKIPNSLKVCTSTRLVPHLTNRDYIYCYPFLDADIDLIILIKNPDSCYPCNSMKEYQLGIDQLKSNPMYEQCIETPDLIAFKKKALPFSF